MAIPNNSLSNLEPGKFVTLEKVHPAGTLQVRKDAIGATYFYWRCTHLGRDFREPIGTFDTKCPPLSMEPTSAGYSRRAAAIKASELQPGHLTMTDGAGERAEQDASIENPCDERAFIARDFHKARRHHSKVRRTVQVVLVCAPSPNHELRT